MANDQRNTVGGRSEARGRSELTGEEVWFVAAGDHVRRLTLDELDEAFALDVLDTSTPVWTEGMETWAPLATVAGLDSPSEGAPDPDDDEDTQRTTPGDILFDSVFPRAAAEHSLSSRGARPVDVAFSGSSSVPVALDVEETVLVRRCRALGKKKKWLLGGVGVLAITGTFGLNLAVQTRDLSLGDSARSAGAAQTPVGPPAIVPARHPTGRQSPMEPRTELLAESERVEPDASDPLPSDGLVHPVAERAVPSQEPQGLARSARAVKAKKPLQTRSAKRAAKKRRSIAQTSGLGKVGSKQRYEDQSLSFDPLNAALPR